MMQTHRRRYRHELTANEMISLMAAHQGRALSALARVRLEELRLLREDGELTKLGHTALRNNGWFIREAM